MSGSGIDVFPQSSPSVPAGRAGAVRRSKRINRRMTGEMRRIIPVNRRNVRGNRRIKHENRRMLPQPRGSIRLVRKTKKLPGHESGGGRPSAVRRSKWINRRIIPANRRTTSEIRRSKRENRRMPPPAQRGSIRLVPKTKKMPGHEPGSGRPSAVRRRKWINRRMTGGDRRITPKNRRTTCGIRRIKHENRRMPPRQPRGAASVSCAYKKAAGSRARQLSLFFSEEPALGLFNGSNERFGFQQHFLPLFLSI